MVSFLENFSSIFRSYGIRVGSDQVVSMGKKIKRERLQDLEEINLSLRMENVLLRRSLEIDEEEKRKMHLQFQYVLEEQIGESSIPEVANNSSKMKPICGHGPNTGYGPLLRMILVNFFSI